MNVLFPIVIAAMAGTLGVIFVMLLAFSTGAIWSVFSKPIKVPLRFLRWFGICVGAAFLVGLGIGISSPTLTLEVVLAGLSPFALIILSASSLLQTSLFGSGTARRGVELHDFEDISLRSAFAKQGKERSGLKAKTKGRSAH